MKQKEQDQEDNTPAFNGAIQTLIRIDELIKHISAYTVNNHLLGLKENLGELLIESQGFLNKQEYKKAWADWDKINKIELRITDDGNVIYDDTLKERLFKFSAWIRYKLHKHKVTMPTKSQLADPLSSIYSKYKL